MPEHKGECEARCRASFARQSIMKTLGATFVTEQPGDAMIEPPIRNDLAQLTDFSMRASLR